MSVKRGIYVAPFEGLADPLAPRGPGAERRGSRMGRLLPLGPRDYRAPTRAVADPVGRAQRLRHRDRAAHGSARWSRRSRAAGSRSWPRDGDPGPPEPPAASSWASGSGATGTASWSRSARSSTRVRERAPGRGLERLANFWAGEFEPRSGPAAADPGLGGRRGGRTAAGSPGRALGRAFPDRPRGARNTGRDGGRGGPSAGGREGPFDFVVTNPPGEDPRPWAEAGATWCLVGFGQQPREAEVRDVIASGPG